MVNYLTKSKYLNGQQCHKRLWYEKNHPERATATSKSQQRIFDQSKEVGRLARDYFPGGLLIDATGPVESVEQTKEAIRCDISYIFEASFIFDCIWVRCDILQKLQKDSNSWRIIEVKASTKVKKEYLHDLAIQKHVLTKQEIPISGTQLMHINQECVYPDLSNLFITEEVTDQVDQLMDNVPDYIKTFKTILDRDVEPSVSIGEQCDKPNPCPFKAYCWKHVPKHSIFTIPNLSKNKKRELVERCILSLGELPPNFSLTQKQRDCVNMVLSGQPEIDNEAIKHQLSDLEYPIHFFDFETYNPAVPRFEGLGPYQQFPFQYSCHILQHDGVVTHHEYLHTDITDPRLPLVESLLDHIGNVGSVIVYSASFERGILKDLAQSFPKHSAGLQSIISRLWDQLLIFREHYKHPEFAGSNSLKNVLPVLVPSFSYQNLDIQEGDEAQAVWDLMIKTTSEEEKSNMIKHLKEYCTMDTRAMVEIHKALLQL